MMLFRLILSVLVSTILLLAITSRPLYTQSEYRRDDYEKPRVCQTCHDTSIRLTSQWRKSMLSLSWIDPLFQHSYRQAGEDTGGKTDVFCPRCHSPIGSLTGNIPPPMDIGRDGICCDFCHTISKATGIGNAAYVSTPGKVKRGQIPDAWSPHHRTAYADLFTRSEFCGMCHNVFDPENPGLMEQATYTEWKESSYRKQGMQCQHCMMNTTEGVFGASEAVQGPYRWVVFEHRFLGGHWEENLKKGALLCLQTDRSEVRVDDTVRYQTSESTMW